MRSALPGRAIDQTRRLPSTFPYAPTIINAPNSGATPGVRNLCACSEPAFLKINIWHTMVCLESSTRVCPRYNTDMFAMSTSKKSRSRLKVRIRRSEIAAPDLFFAPFDRPVLVLDLLHWIRENADATLAYSYSCRIARCGTCAVSLNGRPVLACQELVRDCQSKVSIEPLKGMPIIRDLIVDMQPFVSRWRKVRPFLGSEIYEQDTLILASRPSPGRHIVDASRGCIKCGICYASCGMSGDDRSFLGPAALQHAATLIADSRDRAAKTRLSRVLSDDGVDSCHYHGSCGRVCPRNLDPAAAIAQLRRWRLSGNP